MLQVIDQELVTNFEWDGDTPPVLHDLSACRGATERPSPFVHRFSTAHPEASVEIRALILSANWISPDTIALTFSQA